MLLFKNQFVSFRSVLTILGGWVGFTVLGCSVWIFAHLFLSAPDAVDNAYTTVYKKSSIFSALNRDLNDLSEDDIQIIANNQAVIDIGVFQSSAFRILASMDLPNQSRLATDLFFESVPHKFLDVPFDNTYPENTIPIIIPKTYLNLYNLGFSRSQNLPVVSPGLLKTLVFDLELFGETSTVKMKGKIAGFTTRYNTILIPEEMLQELNHKFGSGVPKKPVKLAVNYKQNQRENLNKVLYDNNMELEDESQASEYLQRIGTVLLTGTLFLSILLISLSGLLIISQIKLSITEKSPLISRYYELGYNPQQLLPSFIKPASWELVFILLPSMVFSELLHRWYLAILDISYNPLPLVYSAAILLFVGAVIWFIQLQNLRKELIKRYI